MLRVRVVGLEHDPVGAVAGVAREGGMVPVAAAGAVLPPGDRQRIAGGALVGGPAERAGAALAVQLVQGVGDLPRLLHRPRYLDRAEVGGGRRGVPRGGGEGVLRLVLPVRVALLRRARPDDPPQGAGTGEEPDVDVARCGRAGVTGGEAAVGGAGESAAQPLHLARRGPAAPQFPVGVPRPLGDQGLVGARLGVVVVEGERAVETGGGRGDGRPGRERCGEGYSGAHGQGGRQDAASGGRGSGGSGRRGGRSMRSDGHDDSWNRGGVAPRGRRAAGPPGRGVRGKGVQPWCRSVRPRRYRRAAEPHAAARMPTPTRNHVRSPDPWDRSATAGAGGGPAGTARSRSAFV